MMNDENKKNNEQEEFEKEQEKIEKEKKDFGMTCSLVGDFNLTNIYFGMPYR